MCEVGSLPTHLDFLVLLDDLPRQCGYRRVDRRLSIRAAATEIGIPPATLHRFEQRRGDSRVSAVAKIARWLTTVDPISGHGAESAPEVEARPQSGDSGDATR